MVAILLTLVLINNTKLHSLGEALTAQDYDMILDIIRHPRLFLPYFGLKKFLQAAALFVMALIGFFYEPVPTQRWLWAGQGGALLVLLGVALPCLVYAYLHTQPSRFSDLSTNFNTLEDMEKLGLMATLWVHGFALRQKPCVNASPFQNISKKTISPLPHLVAIQSESFFDPRPLFTGIRHEILENYDRLCQQAKQYGALHVPAFGANTVRTEFSFLTGLQEKHLGAHRFNPYALASTGFAIPSLPLYLKSLGYTIIVIHPYAAHFYNRQQVFQHWGIDSFLDIKHFAQSHRYGPFVSDIEVAKVIIEKLQQSKNPTCVFAITMENHGPLHLEKKRHKDIPKLYTQTPPTGFDEMTTYLRHLQHADKMLDLLHTYLQSTSTPASLCWYGDHVPILSQVYAQIDNFSPTTNYILWNNNSLQQAHAAVQPQTQELSSHELAHAWLSASLWT